MTTARPPARARLAIARASAVATLALLARGASAQEASPPPTPPTEPVEVVVTGSRTPESSQRATVRTRVVTREEAERRGATNVGEALQGELGVEVNPSAYGARGNPAAIQIQGFDRERVLVLEDGERVIGDVGGVIDLSSIPLTDVSRVELVTGPTSSLYGTSAIGGVVNVISGPPRREGPSARVRLEGQSRWGALVQGSGAYRREESWVLAEGSYQYADAVSLDESRAALALPQRAQRFVGLRAGTRLGSVELKVRGRWIHDAQDGLAEEERPGLPTYLIDLPEIVDRYTLHADETLHLGAGSSVRFSVGRQWALRTSGRDRQGSPADEVRESEDVLQSLEGVATIADGSTRTWVLGARGEIEDLSQRLERTEALPSGLAETEADEVPETRLGSFAAYGQLAWKLAPALTVMPGVRGEWHLRYGGVVAPRLALAFRPAAEVTVRASGGRGFRAPGAKEIGFSLDHSSFGYIVQGNPDLSPETSWGVNGDVTLAPERRVTLRAGVFANWIDDLIDIDIEPIASSGGVDVHTYRNIGAARTAGAEAMATLQAAPWVRTEIGYAYLWTRDDTNERPLEGRPPHTVHAALRAELPGAVELQARYRVVTDAFLDEDLRAPGFHTVDLRVARPLWPSSQGYLGARNVLGVRKDPTRLGDRRPIEGRIIYLGLVAELPWEEEP